MAPIRNLSRVRNPSSKAIEAAETPAIPTARRRAPSTRNKKPGAMAPPVATPLRKGKRGKRGAAPSDEITGVDDSEMPGSEKDPDLTLYCICLGFDTGETPMIQCDVCSNWFHFNCINLNDKDAGDIEAYCCDICEEMGGGKTRRISDASSLKPTRLETVRSSSSGGDGDDFDAHMSDLSSILSDPEDSVREGDESDAEVVDLDEDEFSGEEGQRTTRSRKRAKRNELVKRSTRRKVSGAGELDKKDRDYTGDAESVLRDRPRNRRASQLNITSTTTRRRSITVEEETPSPPTTGKPRGPRRQASQASPVASTSAGATTSTPTSDKTRTHCATQLSTLFQSVFSASDDDANTIGVQARAAAFAETVEAEIFDGFGEVDAKGVKSPRAKYVSKFRSLHYNLKTNANFRSRISANELGPAQIVNMSNEELLTPELRAYADSVRAASLKHSVKEVISAPTAKRTHKGEEEIDNAVVGAVAAEERLFEQREQRELVERERQVTQKRERSTSLAHGSPVMTGSPWLNQGSPSRLYDSPPTDVFSPRTARSRSPPTTAQRVSILSPPASPAATLIPPPLSDVPARRITSPPTEATSAVSEVEVEPALPALPTLGRPRTSFSAANLSISAADLGLDSDLPVVGSPASENIVPDAEPSRNGGPPREPVEGAMLPPPAPAPRTRTSFDMASAWGQIRPSPTLPSTETLESLSVLDQAPTVSAEHEVSTGLTFFDPFDVSAKSTADYDDFEASLLRDEDSATKVLARSTTPPLPPPSSFVGASSVSKSKPLSELEPIWVGDMIVPEEGGFPAFGVQVGGRPFGAAPMIWNQLMPRGLTMDGRIPTSVAVKYLVECSFAPSRELVVVALLPDQTGPSEFFPHKPAGPSCLAKHARIIQFYVRRDRIGVVAPPQTIKHIVKDVYIIPLRKDEAMPEYVDLLEEHNVPETGVREEDMLLCVLVIQKNTLPSQPSTPSTQPVAATSAIPFPSSETSNLDTPSISSLNPSSLHALLQASDTNGLSVLLSNPTVLQSVASGVDTAATRSLLENPNLLAALGDSEASARLLPTLQNLSGIHPSSSSPHNQAPQVDRSTGDGRAWPSYGELANNERQGGSSSPRGGYVHPSRTGLVRDGGSAVPNQWDSGRSFESGEREQWDSPPGRDGRGRGRGYQRGGGYERGRGGTRGWNGRGGRGGFY